MFASIDLAARIDRAEARVSAAVGRAVLSHTGHPDAFLEEIGGGVAVYAGPSSPVNKMIGVGFSGLPPAERLEEIEQQFRNRHAPLQAEVATLADPGFATSLTRRGYVLENFENVLGRPITRADGEPTHDRIIEILPMQDGQAAEWLDASITGFLHSDEQGVPAAALPPREALEQLLGPFMDVPEFRRYCAWIDGHLAGVATLRLDDGLAQLCGAATLPAFRRRGVQSMLLRRRLADAFDRGCELALMTTQPGSKSQQNGYRQGFMLLYSRAVLVRHPDYTPRLP